MKKIYQGTVGGILLLMVCFAGCSKSNSSSKSNADLIKASAWKYDTAGLDANNDGNIDAPLPDGTILDCQKDNTLTFTTDSTGIVDEGATKCNVAAPQTIPFTWSFNTDQTVINLPDSLFGGLGGAVNIKSLTATQLHFEKAITYSGLTFNVAVYLKH